MYDHSRMKRTYLDDVVLVVSAEVERPREREGHAAAAHHGELLGWYFNKNKLDLKYM